MGTIEFPKGQRPALMTYRNETLRLAAPDGQLRPQAVVRSIDLWCILFTFLPLVVFQSFYSSDGIKLGYLAAFVAAGAIGFGGCLQDPKLRILAVSSHMAIVYVSAQAVRAYVSGVAPQAVLRDSIAYHLLAISPLVGVWLARRQVAITFSLVAVLGLLSSAAFLLTWTQKRGFSGLTSLRLAMNSPSLVIFSLVWLVNASASKTVKHRWTTLAVIVMVCVCMLATGNRTSVALIAYSLGFGLWPERRAIASGEGLTRLVSAIILMIPIVALLLWLLSAFVDVVAALERSFSLFSFSTSDYLEDSSGFDRQTQTDLAWTRIKNRPLFGEKFGTVYSYYSPSIGRNLANNTLDSGLSALLKLGAIGVGLFGILSCVLLYRSRSSEFVGPPVAALKALLVSSLAMAPLYAPSEDKGLAIAIMLCCACVFSEQSGQWPVSAMSSRYDE